MGPCPVVTENLATMLHAVTWKIQTLPINQNGLAKEISRQTDEGAECLLVV